VECPALDTLSRDAADLVFAEMESHEYEAGESLMEEGAWGDYLFLLTGGTASARSNLAEGGDQHVASFGRGDIVGEMALVTKGPRSATVIADTPVSALALRAGHFEDLASRHPELGVVLTHLIAERLGEQRVDGLGGKLIGTFRIRRCIARGNMGVVYEAEDVRDDEPVALKMMSHRLLYEPGGVRRFQREADILLTLAHPNITRFHERFEALRTSFIAMEYCDGPTLGSVIRTHAPLPESEVRKVIGQIAQALSYLHAQGVVHRDLKPENVITTSDGYVRLTDFGLAKNLNPMGTLSTSGERPFLGTPIYMAPEQISGRRVTGATDVYALACVALQMLDGRIPFDDSNFAALIMSKMAFQLPSAEDIGTGISSELHDVLAKALSNDIADRTVDLEALAGWAAPLDPRLVAPPDASRDRD